MLVASTCQALIGWWCVGQRSTEQRALQLGFLLQQPMLAAGIGCSSLCDTVMASLCPMTCKVSAPPGS